MHPTIVTASSNAIIPYNFFISNISFRTIHNDYILPKALAFNFFDLAVFGIIDCIARRHVSGHDFSAAYKHGAGNHLNLVTMQMAVEDNIKVHMCFCNCLFVGKANPFAGDFYFSKVAEIFQVRPAASAYYANNLCFKI